MNIKTLFKLGYGVYVVTSKKGDRFNGQIANTVFQVTSEPPTVAVSINETILPTSSSRKAKSLPPPFSARKHPSPSLAALALSRAGIATSLKGLTTR
jgi:hypothetical protein